MNSRSDFSKLPLEILLEIFPYLSLRDINNLHSLNTRRTPFNEITDENKYYPQIFNKLWEKKLQQHFPKEYAQLKQDHTANNQPIRGYWYNVFKNVYQSNYKYFTPEEKKIYNLIKEGNTKDIVKAIQQNALNIFKFFKVAGCKPKSPLSLILQTCSQDILNALYAKKNAAFSVFECSKLEWAIICNQSIDEITELLKTYTLLDTPKVISYGFDFFLTDGQYNYFSLNQTLIREAIQFNRVEVINLFLMQSDTISTHTIELLKHAIIYNRLNIFKIVLDRYANSERKINKEFTTAEYERLILTLIQFSPTNGLADSKKIIESLNNHYPSKKALSNNTSINFLSATIQYGQPDILTSMSENQISLTQECLQNTLTHLFSQSTLPPTALNKRAFLNLLNHNIEMSKTSITNLINSVHGLINNNYLSYPEKFSRYLNANDSASWQNYIYERTAELFYSNESKISNLEQISDILLNYAFELEQSLPLIIKLVDQLGKQDPMHAEALAFSYARWDVVEFLLKDKHQIEYWFKYLKHVINLYADPSRKGFVNVIKLLKKRFTENEIQAHYLSLYSAIRQIQSSNDGQAANAFIRLVLTEFPCILSFKPTKKMTMISNLLTCHEGVTTASALQISTYLDHQLTNAKITDIELFNDLMAALDSAINELISKTFEQNGWWNQSIQSIAHDFWMLRKKHGGQQTQLFNERIGKYIDSRSKYNGLMMIILAATHNDDIVYEDIKHMVTKESANYQINYPHGYIFGKFEPNHQKAIDFAFCLPNNNKIRTPLIKAILKHNDLLMALCDKGKRASLLAANASIPDGLRFKCIPTGRTESLIIELIDYIFAHHREKSYIPKIKLFNRFTIYERKYQKEQKLDAAAALLKYWLSDTPDASLLADHLGALTNGRLGKLVSKYKYYINPILAYEDQLKISAPKQHKIFKS